MATQHCFIFGFILVAVVAVCTEGVCLDNVACHLYAKEICTDPQYLQWSSKSCAKFCGFCQNGETTQSSGIGRYMDQSNEMNTCKDKVPNCAEYGKTICDDVKFYTWTMENCKSYCGKCQIACEDKAKNCADYGDTLCTELSYYNWVEINCRKFCARCT